ncbi:MAG: hypothetical protein K8U57_31250 [Planctomycetes bacterium]|nr:hypothetical protein [Planctomycetota bacterium]
MTKQKRRTQLGMETLELRENPAVVAVFSLGNDVYVSTDNNGCVTDITRASPMDDLKVVDYTSGKTWTIDLQFGQFPTVHFNGGSGGDQIYASNAFVPFDMKGNGGNDILIGGLFGDRIDGGAGNDLVRGSGGGDTLYGRSGADTLEGGDGDDFLDAGANTGDSESGGAGYDFLAHQIAVNSTTDTDVNQRGTPSCWIDAPLASAAKAGINLASRINYMGEGVYQVRLLDANGGSHYQMVSLEDGRLSFEPATVDDESWVIIYQRAIQQQMGHDWHDVSDYSSGWPSNVLSYLTGRSVSGYGNEITGGGYNTTNDAEMQSIKNKLAAGKLVCACTRQGDYGSWNIAGSVSTGKLCGAHCYSVESVNMNAGTVLLRNPWGLDQDGGDNPHVKYTDGPNDGYVTITFQQFYDSMWSYAVS